MVNRIFSQSVLAGSVPANGKLKKAARDFEALLITDLLKAGPKTSNIEGASDSGGGESYEDLSTEAVASAMAANGGLGIGRMLLKKLNRPEASGEIKGFSLIADH